MPGSAGSNFGLTYGYTTGEAWSFAADFARLDTLVSLSVVSASVTAPPGSPAAGDRYIIAATATGAWTGKENQVARYNGTAWEYQTAPDGQVAYDESRGAWRLFNGSSWSFSTDLSLGVRSAFTSYYCSEAVLQASTAGAAVADRIYYQPFNLPNDVVDRIGINVTTGSAGACRLGLYAADNAGMPGSLIQDCGTVDTTSIAMVEASFSALRLPPKRVWAAATFNATPTNTIGSASGSHVLGTSTPGTAFRGLVVTKSYGVLASTAVAPTGFVSQAPMILLRKS